MNIRNYVLALAALAVAGSVASAQVVFGPGTSLAPIPAQAGTGLDGNIWTGDVNSIAAARTRISAGSAEGSFLATLIDYPNVGDVVPASATLGEMLGIDAATLTGLLPTAGSLSNTFVFSGFIAISDPATYAFAVGSDDGFELRINGVLVSNFDGDRGFAFTTQDVSFSDAGLYAIELLYWANNSTESGVQFAFANPLAIVNVPTGILYTQIPSPAAAMVLGAAMLMGSRRQR